MNTLQISVGHFSRGGIVSPLTGIMNGLNPPPQVTENFMVPDQLVGLIIGKNGEQINRIQQETGCRVQIVPHSMGTNERPCTLIGNVNQVLMAKQKLQEIILRGGPRENGQNQFNHGDSKSQGQVTIELQIPPDKCGLIIGKGGNTLKQMMQEHSVKLHLVQESAEITKDEKPLKIIGTAHQVEEAKRAVLGLMAQKDGNKTGPAGPMGKPTIEVSVSLPYEVPKAAVGVVIGRGGENISRIQSETGTRIQFKPDDPNLETRGCVITGTQDACHQAQEKIKDIAAQKLAEHGQGPLTQPVSMFDVGQHTVEYPVPANRAGVVIGKGGENIRLIKEKSGAFVQIEKGSGPGSMDKMENWKTFIIRGTDQQIQEAQKLIQEKAGVAPPQNSLPNPANSINSLGHYDVHGAGTPLATPGTPNHPNTPTQMNSLNMQMSQINLGTPGTPGPPHPSQQVGVWAHEPTQEPINQHWYSMYQQPNQGQWNQQQWNQQQQHQQPHQQISQQRGQPQQPQQGSNQGQPQDYSKQWQEYWRQMGSMQDPHGQHSPYNQHGQMMSQQQQSAISSNEQQWRDYYSTQYSNQYTPQYHQEPGLNSYPIEIPNISDSLLLDCPSNYDSTINQDISPNATSRYTPQSQY